MKEQGFNLMLAGSAEEPQMMAPETPQASQGASSNLQPAIRRFGQKIETASESDMTIENFGMTGSNILPTRDSRVSNRSVAHH